MILKEIINIIEKWAPVKHAEDFDNVGLLVGNPTNSVKKALITIDTLENVVDEAEAPVANNAANQHARFPLTPDLLMLSQM